jgi:UrcA family protein
MYDWKSLTRAARRPLALALIAGPLLGSTALATESAARSVTVNYEDVNLTTLAGATRLYQRISDAARQVCGEPGYGLQARRLWQDCYRAAVADAVAAVNSPMLTTVYRDDSKAEPAA